MRRNSSRLFELIHLQVSILGLYIQITVGVVANGIQTAAGALVARWISVEDPEYSCLIFDTLISIYLFIIDGWYNT